MSTFWILKLLAGGGLIVEYNDNLQGSTLSGSNVFAATLSTTKSVMKLTPVWSKIKHSKIHNKTWSLHDIPYPGESGCLFGLGEVAMPPPGRRALLSRRLDRKGTVPLS